MGDHRGSRAGFGGTAGDRRLCPFPPALTVFKNVHLKSDMNQLPTAAAHLLDRKHQCQGKMIVSLIPSSSHEINITWQFLPE